MVLDDNLPIYRFRPSSDDPLASLLYYTHMGSEPSAEYLLRRPPPAQSHNRYAIGLFDPQYASVLYAEALVNPEWSQPTLSAAEVRASGGAPVATPLTPQSFTLTLYNPEQTVTVRQANNSSWSKDAWEFEMPERSFRLPSASKIDQDDPGPAVADLIPKVNFRWKRDSRMSRHMSCYMSGRTVGGQKSKEPDITIALFEGGKTEGAVAIYEPNMARVDVQDRKGLEMVLLLSAEIIRDLYLAPRQDPFNTAGAPPPPISSATANGNASSSSPGPHQPLQKQPTIPVAASGGAAAMSGAMGDPSRPSASSSSQQPSTATSSADARRQADIDAEKRRVQVLVEQEQEKARERERRDREEQDRIKQMLEEEEREERERRRREVEQETERLRQQYGVQPENERRPRSPPSPNLPPRPGGGGQGPVMSGGGTGFSTSGAPVQPPRPQSVGPIGSTSSDHVYSQQNSGGGAGGGNNAAAGGRRHKFGQFLQSSPYAGPAAASVSGFFGSGNNNNASNSKEEEKRKKVKKKRSVHF